MFALPHNLLFISIYNGNFGKKLLNLVVNIKQFGYDIHLYFMQFPLTMYLLNYGNISMSIILHNLMINNRFSILMWQKFFTVKVSVRIYRD